MTVLKVIEVLASSKKSWEDATQSEVKIASNPLKGINSVYIQDMSAIVKTNKTIVNKFIIRARTKAILTVIYDYVVDLHEIKILFLPTLF